MSTSVAINRNKAILYARIIMLSTISVISIIGNTLYTKPLNAGLGLFNGLFNVSLLSLYISIFVLILVSLISILTGFFPNKPYLLNSSYLYKNKEINNEYYNAKNNILFNKNATQFTIIEYSLIILFILCGVMFLISTGDLVSLFLSIELQSYGLYILCTIYRDSESSTNSGLTYFLLGGLSSCFILLASAILYVNSGNTNLDNIFILNNISELSCYLLESSKEYIYFNKTIYLFTENTSDYIMNYTNLSFIILIVGLLFKISAAPFHFWSPDVYDGVPTIVTTFVAIVAKISLLIVMLEFIIHTDIITNNGSEIIEITEGKTNYKNYEWKNIIILSSLMSLVIGSILGLTQYRIKRLFAYSTISHVGFILLALCVNKIDSIQGYIFYILQYSISNLNAFFVLIIIGYTLHEYILKNTYTKKDKENNEDKNKITIKNSSFQLSNQVKGDLYIDVNNSPLQLSNQLKGYFYINPYISITFAITLFSFVGIPPLIGFFAKQMVLSAALDQGYIFIVFVAVITSVIGAAYYLNLVKLIFFTKSDYTRNTYSDSNVNKSGKVSYTVMCINDKLSLTVSILTMLILLFILVPDEWFRIVSLLSLSICKY